MASTEKPLVIPIFIPHCGCPHQCVFCNQKLITSSKAIVPDKLQIRHTIEEYLQYKGDRIYVEAAFFGGNFLGLPPGEIEKLLKAVQPFIDDGKVDAIRFSTRPDTVTEQSLSEICACPVSMVELGAQSMNDEVLKAAKRGHSAGDTRAAVALLKENGYRTGLQLMVGLPRDTEAALLESTIQAARLKPDIIRIYPLLVMAESPLEKWYQKGRYIPLNLDQAIALVKKMIRIFDRYKIPVTRTGLQATDFLNDTEKVLAGPWHPAFGHLVYSGLMYDEVVSQIEAQPDLKKNSRIYIHIHPASESRVRGDKNQNTKKLYAKYGFREIVFARNNYLDPSKVKVASTNEIF